MNRDEVYERLCMVFRSVFGEDVVVCEETAVEDVEDEAWDSFEQINLVVAAEQEFGIRFDMKQAKNFRNVGEMVDAIMARLHA